MDKLALAQSINRRSFLQRSGVGLGAAALGLLTGQGVAGANQSAASEELLAHFPLVSGDLGPERPPLAPASGDADDVQGHWVAQRGTEEDRPVHGVELKGMTELGESDQFGPLTAERLEFVEGQLEVGDQQRVILEALQISDR